MTRTVFSESSAARSAAIRTFGEFGSTTTSSAGTSWMPAQQLVGRGVERRAAVQHVRAEALEELAHAVAGDDGEHAAGVDRLAHADRALLDLLVHVGDVEPGDLAGVLEQRRSARSGSSVWTWTFSVCGVADHEHRVAEALEPGDPRRLARGPGPVTAKFVQ